MGAQQALCKPQPRAAGLGLYGHPAYTVRMVAAAFAPVRRRPAGADPFAALNEEQRTAVFHGPAEAPPPLLIVAGAGSGKTLTLAARVARLLLEGADPQRLMLLSFSRRAAQALQQRAARMLHQALGLGAAQPPPELPWAGTFHSVAARLLREHAALIGLAEDFVIADRADSEDLLGWVRDEQGLARTRRRFPLKGSCLAIHSRAVNAREPLAQVLHAQFPWCAQWEPELRALFRAYTAEKQRQHLLDYDDLLLWWQAMLDDDALAHALGARFAHVLVDEYQDTNRLQAAILQRLKPDGRGLAVVGDDAQSIYAFRAAEVRNLLGFAQQFEPPAALLRLQRNYRSSDAILRACNALMADAPEGIAKTLWSDRRDGALPQWVALADEAEQAGWVADQVLLQREAGTLLRRQAVLFRTGHHSAALELELLRRDIPYVKYGGLKFLEAAHVKDLLALLRWVQNPRARLAGFRVLQLADGIGAAGARRLLDAIAAAADPAQAMQAYAPPRAAAAGWRALHAACGAIAAAPWPQAIAQALAWYRPQLPRLYADAAARAADLDLLEHLAARHRCREDFLAELTLDPPEASSDVVPPQRDDDYLILSTIHSAKGQEWAAVYVLNVVDGCIPSDMAAGSSAELEEERRLLYVAMTRAQHRLQLLVPQRFHVTQQRALGDRHVWGAPSRFLTPAVLACLDAVVPQPPARAAPPQPQPFAGGGIAARLRAQWD